MGKERESVKSQGMVKSNGSIIWQKLIEFGGTEKFVPELIERVVVEGSGIGSIRTIHIKGGGQIIEKFTSINADKMEMKFIIISTPMPIQNYEGIFTVTSIDDTTCSVLFESIYHVLSEQKAEIYNIIKNFQTVFISNLDK
ncbi:SRPBCC family protein [Flavobacterium sp. MDT1-60]|uniref:SRPBCC family protein n=1 Tax=Flavobacterium sp. MDT1-60 TaxID=1979344 RepID=UPI00178114A6|nr:SRPBCC family protein [Flavobacterium sp. MDT1-60]QOG02140.1 SRPBCC family protein [Flavobacterium sp. MDT1-60]